MRLRGYAEILAAAAVAEYKFLLVQPSLLAAACLAAACQGLALDALLLDILPPALLAQAGQVSVLADHLEDLTAAHIQASNAHFSSSFSSSSSTRLPPFHTVAKTAPYYPQQEPHYPQEPLFHFLSLTTSAIGG